MPIGPMPPPPIPPEATGATPPNALLTAIAGSAATNTGEVPPTSLPISGVCALPPPEPGNDAALTRPAPELGPDPPAAGWVENAEKGIGPLPVPPLPAE